MVKKIKKHGAKPMPNSTPHSKSQPNISNPNQQPKQQSLIQINIDALLQNLPSVGSNSSLIEAIEKKREGNKLISIVLNAGVPLDNSIILPLFEILQKNGTAEKIDLFLHTTGGQTEVPWRIITLLREFCKEYFAIVPHIALSAGTHIALGADAILMSEISTLGPVDPTRQHALLPKDSSGNTIPVSVEDLKHCIRFIRQQIEGDYSPSDMSTIINTLFSHIEPLAIGAIEQSYMLSRLITQKALETHLDADKEKEKINKIVDKIGGEYYSHSFPITRRDVEQELGLKVIRPTSDLWSAIWNLHTYYQDQFAKQAKITLPVPPVAGQQAPPEMLVTYVGFIDTVGERRILVGLTQFMQTQAGIQPVQVAKKWIAQKNN